MSVAEIRKWVTTNDYFAGGRDIADSDNLFVSSRNKYPHIHIGRDFITYSKGADNHMYLIEKGGVVRKPRIDTAVQDAPKDAHIMQLLRYMSSQL
jgi:hypothetical protein